jgi:hypothetical protein
MEIESERCLIVGRQTAAWDCDFLNGHFPDERDPLPPPSLDTALVASKARVVSTPWAAESTALTPATGFWDLSEGIPA